MNTLLVLNSSGRVTRSITRRLTARFTERWLARNTSGRVIARDLTANPPPVVNEAWIAASFGDPFADPVPEVLQLSNTLISEIEAADAIVIGAPIYNFGMPAQLKAYFDQIVRSGRTYTFDADAESPYQSLLRDKPVFVITSAGDAEMYPGGSFAHMNHLEPHLITVLGFIGLTDLHFIRVGHEEYKDDRFQRSLEAAESAIELSVQQLSAGVPLCAAAT